MVGGLDMNNIYKVYARSKDGYYVDKIFSNFHEKSTDADIFVKEGNTIEYIHVGYNVYDEHFCHNYKIESGKMVETTKEDKQKELDSRKQIPTFEEKIEKKISILEQNNKELREELNQIQTSIAALITTTIEK